ncbi:MAG: hypothetical protein WCF92_00435 [bacterium]
MLKDTNITAKMILARINQGIISNAANILGRTIDGKVRPGGVVVVEVFYNDYQEYSTCGSMSIGSPGANMHNNAFFAHEKIRRLRNLRQEGTDHVASSESADPDKAQYGGAICAFAGINVEVYLSYSGAPQEVDEVISYVLAKQLGLQVSQKYTNPLLLQATKLLVGACIQL